MTGDDILLAMTSLGFDHDSQVLRLHLEEYNEYANYPGKGRKTCISGFHSHDFPLARIKEVIKADEEVQMISAEVLVVFAKACGLLSPN